MAYITTSIDVDLEEFDDDELVDELESRGYEVYDKGEFKKSNNTAVKSYYNSISNLYSTYMTCSSDLFEKQLKKFFCEHLDVIV